MAELRPNFSDVGVSSQLYVRKGNSFTYSIDVSNDFDGIIQLRRSDNGGASYDILLATNAAVSNTLVEDVAGGAYDFRCILGAANTITGTANCVFAHEATVMKSVVSQSGEVIYQQTNESVSTVKRVSQKYVTPAVGNARVGLTAGWNTTAPVDTCLVTLPAGQTNSTLVVPVNGPKVGSTIKGFHLVGQAESGGNNVVINASLRKMTSAAADVADALVSAMTELTVNSDTIISSANAGVTGLSESVGADENFYVLIRATTGASTDIALQSIAVIVDEA